MFFTCSYAQNKFYLAISLNFNWEFTSEQRLFFVCEIYSEKFGIR